MAAGHKPAKWRDSFFAEYYKELGNVPACYAIRSPTHKLVKYPGHPEWTEVFDLSADPYLVKNLASDERLINKLAEQLARLAKDVGYTEPKVTAAPKSPQAALPIIDTHVHLWRPRKTTRNPNRFVRTITTLRNHRQLEPNPCSIAANSATVKQSFAIKHFMDSLDLARSW